MALLALTAVGVAVLRDLFAAVMVMGLYSLLSASWMLVLDAPDVAFTEAAVGAGVSTVLMLAVLARTPEVEKRPDRLRPGPLIVTLITGMVLLYATLDMPAFGDPASVIHHHVAPAYLAGTAHDIGIANVISAVLASYRGYDTLGETSVVLTAAVGVLAILARPRLSSPPASAAGRSDWEREETVELDERTVEVMRALGGE